MKPEDVPDEIVDKALQASAPHITTEFNEAEMVVLRGWVRRSLALAWDDIFGAGFTEGFSTKISMEKTADNYEPAEGPALSEYEKQHRVIVVDHYDDGALEVAYREAVPAAPLTLAARGNHSVDMKVKTLTDAIFRAGGPRLYAADKEAVAKIMRDHRAQVWSDGKVECRCNMQFPSEHLQEMRVAERADALLTAHEQHVYRQVVEAFYE